MLIKPAAIVVASFVPYLGLSVVDAASVPDLAVDVAKSAPALVVLGYIVLRYTRVSETKDRVFLDEIRAEREARERADELREKTLERIGDKCHATQDRASDVMERNTEALGTVREQLANNADKFEKAVDRIERSIERMQQG